MVGNDPHRSGDTAYNGWEREWSKKSGSTITGYDIPLLSCDVKAPSWVYGELLVIH